MMNIMDLASKYLPGDSSWSLEMKVDRHNYQYLMRPFKSARPALEKINKIFFKIPRFRKNEYNWGKVPELEKLTDGISKDYSNGDESSDSYEHRHRRKVRRPPKKKKKKLVLIKRKLQIPEPEIPPPLLREKNYRWSALPKAASAFRNFSQLKKKGKKASKAVKVKNEKHQAGQSGDGKKKSKNKKKVKVDPKSVGKALEEFQKKKTKFMASLKLLQQHLSNFRIEKLKETPKRKTSKRKSSDKSLKKSKKKKISSSSSASSSSSSSSESESGSDSSSEESTSTSTVSTEVKVKAKQRKERFPRKTTSPVKLTKRAYTGDTTPNSQFTCFHQVPSVTLPHMFPHPDEKQLKVDEAKKPVSKPFEFCKIFEPKPISGKLLEERIKRANYQTTRPLFTAKRPKGKPDVRTKDEIVKEAQRPFYLESESSSQVSKPQTSCHCIINTMKNTLPKCTVYRQY